MSARLKGHVENVNPALVFAYRDIELVRNTKLFREAMGFKFFAQPIPTTG